MKVLVLGATGMLGASLVPALAASGHAVIAHGRASGVEQVDLGDAQAARGLLLRVQPQATINLVACTDVDLCERSPQLAWAANVRAVEHVAAACSAAGSHLLQVSTDHVYDGPGPCAEVMARPGNYYALTKYGGELAALATGATVVRTNFFGASRHTTRRSLTDWLHASLTEGKEVRVFDDVYFSPLSIRTLCAMLERLAAVRAAGVYNLGSRDGLSKADFAFAFARAAGLPAVMRRASVREAQLGAWRPTDMRMDSAKMETLLGTAMPRLEDEIQLAAEDYRAHV